jgi:hypothetical protein
MLYCDRRLDDTDLEIMNIFARDYSPSHYIGISSHIQESGRPRYMCGLTLRRRTYSRVPKNFILNTCLI